MAISICDKCGTAFSSATGEPGTCPLCRTQGHAGMSDGAKPPPTPTNAGKGGKGGKGGKAGKDGKWYESFSEPAVSPFPVEVEKAGKGRGSKPAKENAKLKSPSNKTPADESRPAPKIRKRKDTEGALSLPAPRKFGGKTNVQQMPPKRRSRPSSGWYFMVGFGLGTVMLMAYGATLLIIGGAGKGRRMSPVATPDSEVAVAAHDPGAPGDPPPGHEDPAPAIARPETPPRANPEPPVKPTPAPKPTPAVKPAPEQPKVRPTLAPRPKARPTPAPRPKVRPTPVPAPRPKTRPTPAPAPKLKAKPATGPAAERAAASREFFRQGLQQLMQGNASGAVVQFNRALEKNPRYAQAYRGMGLAYQKLGRKTMARAAFRRYLILSPKARDAEAIRKRIEMLQ